MNLDLDMPPSPPPIEATLAARRARRQAIIARYAGVTSVGASPSPGPSSAVQPPQPHSSLSNPVSQTRSITGTPIITETEVQKTANGASSQSSAHFFLAYIDLRLSVGKRESMSASPTPEQFTLAKDGEDDAQVKVQVDNGDAEQVFAADYDPSQDRREEEQRRVRVVQDEVLPEIVETVDEEEEEEGDIDDMFAVVTGDKKVRKVKKITVSNLSVFSLLINADFTSQKPAAPALITTTLDSAADPEGYYQVILGEQLDGGRYQVFSSLGKGMFANVVRARILQGDAGDAGQEVAIKIIRCQESMFVLALSSFAHPNTDLRPRYRAGLKEVQILNKLKQADPEDKKHIVRLERTFEHRGHLCLVFESMRFVLSSSQLMQLMSMMVQSIFLIQHESTGRCEAFWQRYRP